MKELEAVEIAMNGHKGQVDKSGEPKLGHVVRVARRLSEKGYNSDVVVVALLHDLFEDTDAEFSDFYGDLFDWQLVALDALTRRDEETYADYILRVRDDETATLVKLADLADNTDPKRGVFLSLLGRYTRAKAVLEGRETT